MNAIDLLVQEHGDLEDLFHELWGAKDSATKGLIFGDIAAKLEIHAALEARLLDRAAATSRIEVLGGRSSRRQNIDDLLADIRQNVASRAFDAKVAQLQEEFECEAEEIETDLASKLADLLGQDGLETLGAELVAVRAGLDPATEAPVAAAA